MLNSPEWSAFYLWKNGAIVPENAARCPKPLSAVADVPLARVRNRSPSILFSLLRPGARIPPHTGEVNTRLICHLPLIVPPNCSFRVGNDTRVTVEGRAWVFDDTIEHEAWNGSDRTRVILLFEIWRPELTVEERGLVSAMFEAIDAYKPVRSVDVEVGDACGNTQHARFRRRGDFVAPRLVRLGEGALQGGGHVRGDALGVVRPDPARHIPCVVQVLPPVAADLGPDRVDQDLAIGGEIRIRTQVELVEIPGLHRDEALARSLARGLGLGCASRRSEHRNAKNEKRSKNHGRLLPVACNVLATLRLDRPRRIGVQVLSRFPGIDTA